MTTQIMSPNHILWFCFLRALAGEITYNLDSPEELLRQNVLREFGFDEESVRASISYLKNSVYARLTCEMLVEAEKYEREG